MACESDRDSWVGIEKPLPRRIQALPVHPDLSAITRVFRHHTGGLDGDPIIQAHGAHKGLIIEAVLPDALVATTTGRIMARRT